MFNIQKAVSRLDYAPKLNEIEVTDIKKGLGVFKPRPEKAVSFASLKNNLKKAGYTLAMADITIIGKLSNEGGRWSINSTTSGQKFSLEGNDAGRLVEAADKAEIVELTGRWITVGTGTSAKEVVDPQKITPKPAVAKTENNVYFIRTGFGPAPYERETGKAEAKAIAPIRITSPGLTVYKGGAFTPRIYFEKQHLGDLKVTRQIVELSASYTPTPRVQLEIVLPFSRTNYNDRIRSGSNFGLGNITLWGKYRFFRKVKTYGDRQASARFGLELPTGKSSAPSARAVNTSAFVRQQLTPINGGFAPHFDVSFSQAGGRFIFGGNAEGIYRTTRGGFRLGHELRLNTDFEYVLFPRHYQKPGGELFAILESSLVTRSKGRFAGNVAPGSSSTVYYLSPGLQYAARTQFVVEGSIQLPVFRNAGSHVLRTDYNLLLGVRYLF